MKLKKSTLIIFGAAVSAFVLRILQIFFTIEQSTGFLKTKKTELGIFLTCVVVALCVLAAVVARICDFEANSGREKGALTAIVCGIASIAFFYEAFNEKFVFPATSWQAVAMKTIGFFTAVYFAALLFSNLFGFKVPDFCHLLPAFYMIIRIICSFIGISSLSLIIENIFLIASYCAVLVFFISYAADKCGVFINGTSFYMRSVLAFLLCLVTAIPNLIANATSLGGYSHIPLSSQVVLTAITLFIAVFKFKKFSR